MEPIFNMDDPVGKTVGRRSGPNGLTVVVGEAEAKRAWAEAGLFPKYPRGVFRFKTFEEADQWTMKYQTMPQTGG